MIIEFLALVLSVDLVFLLVENSKKIFSVYLNYQIITRPIKGNATLKNGELRFQDESPAMNGLSVCK